MEVAAVGSCRSLSYSQAAILLEAQMSNLLRMPYPDIMADFDDRIVNSYTIPVKPCADFERGTIFTTIGIGKLMQNMDADGYVRDVDLVSAVNSIAHEARHVFQLQRIYQKDDLSGFELDMARAHMISSVMRGYYMRHYYQQPFEIDAVLSGLRYTVDYFDRYVQNADGSLKIDSRSCLVQHVKELSRWYGDRDCVTFDDMLSSVESHLRDYENFSHIEDFKTDPTDHNWFRKRIMSAWSPEFDKCSSRGVEADKVLFSAAMDLDPWYVTMWKGLQPEARRIRALYPSKRSFIEKLHRKSMGHPVYEVADRFCAQQYDASDIDLSGIDFSDGDEKTGPDDLP